jgi:hypothetical protein
VKGKKIKEEKEKREKEIKMRNRKGDEEKRGE